LAELASALNNLSERLTDFDRCEEALAASEEAVRLYREVAGGSGDSFLPEVASALNNLSKRLSEFDRREEPLAASEEAVRLYREIAGHNATAFRLEPWTTSANDCWTSIDKMRPSLPAKRPVDSIARLPPEAEVLWMHPSPSD
jgi:hypothetical protein